MNMLRNVVESVTLEHYEELRCIVQQCDECIVVEVFEESHHRYLNENVAPSSKDFWKKKSEVGRLEVHEKTEDEDVKLQTTTTNKATSYPTPIIVS